MQSCPNCSAELKARPCPACGWPESTAPPQDVLSALRRGRAAGARDDDEGFEAGLCGGLGCCMLPVAFASTAGAVFCYRVGEAAKWTSDGPGILIFMLGLVVCAPLAVISWGALLLSWLWPFLPRPLRMVIGFFMDG